MNKKNNSFVVEVKPSHLNWGTYRHSNTRDPIEGESYVKIPSQYARMFNIVRGTEYKAYFKNGFPTINIKAAGNGPFENGIQYAKQFEGVGRGACKAFTPWYASVNIEVGDRVKVTFLSATEIEFEKL